MSEETIQTDVSDAEIPAVTGEEQAPEASTPETPEDNSAVQFSDDPVSKRERMKDVVAEKRREQVESDRKAMALINDPDLSAEEYDAAQAALEETPPDEVLPGQEGEIPAGAGEAVAVDESEGANAADAPAAPPAPNENGWRTTEDGTRVKTLMVNGQPRDFTEEQYDRQIQKDLAGDEKLRQAAQAAQQLEQRERQLQEREQQLQAQEQPPAQGADVSSLIAEHSELLLEGDMDAANAKMAEILDAGRGSSTPNLDDIASRAATQVEQRQARQAHQESIDEGWEEFQRDYAAVLQDSDAMIVADAHIKKLRAENPAIAPKDAILKAGEYAVERLGLTAATPAPAPAPDAARAERQQRKANLKPLPSASGARHVVKEAPKVDNSPQAKIARMRKSRIVA